MRVLRSFELAAVAGGEDGGDSGSCGSDGSCGNDGGFGGDGYSGHYFWKNFCESFFQIANRKLALFVVASALSMPGWAAGGA